MTPWYVYVSISISILAIAVASLTYRRKAGVRIYGNYVSASSRDCNDKYISSITLENLKDRAITIFTIYLRIGYNYYIIIENFEDSPLILKPFETYQKNYGPIQFYGINSNRINLDSLLEDAKIKKRIILSTSDGRYIVEDNIKKWNPIGDFFRNHWTVVIQPIRTIYKDKEIGSNIKYVVEFVGNNGEERIVTIHPEDYRLETFMNFSLTRDSLSTQESLTDYLDLQISKGNLIYKKFHVYDADLWKIKTNEFFKGQPIKAKHIGYLRYKILGRIFTWYSDRKLRKENLKRLKK